MDNESFTEYKPSGCKDVLSRDELLLFLQSECSGEKVGFLGYPNVGKSSTINSLIGEKKVAVAITPGKTKHFQVHTKSIHMSTSNNLRLLS